MLHSPLFTQYVFIHHFAFYQELLLICGPLLLSCLPAITPNQLGRQLSLSELGSVRGFFLLKWSFSFTLLPGACSSRDHLIVEVFLCVIVGSLTYLFFFFSLFSSTVYYRFFNSVFCLTTSVILPKACNPPTMDTFKLALKIYLLFTCCYVSCHVSLVFLKLGFWSS